ncbi:MAG: aminopeptidase P N-terminal domain-containing protein [Bacteroidetes bacterium]|nr:aminopeptidase P N-terminal domain-containing protein [Bacteroidota bacterium]
MKYEQINNRLFIENREKFKKTLKPNSIAVFTSNYEYVLNGDATHTFKQNSNLFWLCGIDQEDTFLVIYPDCAIEEFREALFLKQTNENIAIWEGYKYTKEHAISTSGIENIYWNDGFWEKIRPIVNLAENVYLSLNENDRYSYKSPYSEIDFAKEFQKRFPLHKYERSSPALQRLRSIKSDFEIELVKKAIAISKKGFERILKFTKPGVWEYEIEAELIHEYIRNKATGHSFHPIIASGASACVLHYIENNRQCKDGDVLLVDCGVDYANYASDMTRVIPVNGKFTKRQKDVYNAVLRVMRGASKLLVPGTMLMEYHKHVGKELMEKELVDLGLLTMDEIKNENPLNPAYKKYFMHGTSHFLGVDVHDSGMRYEPMQAGNLFTCEPGIYIREENLGIRLENNLIITNNGTIDLMDLCKMPIEAEEIEDLMNQ